jgi:uncharacterized YigZ family protein
LTLASYQVPAKECQIEQEVKRSKFLGFVAPATSRQEADDFIRTIRKQHPHANHVCWAYIVGAPNTTIRSMSDDGEPNGTAGMPMLKVLEYSGYGDIMVVVVRYFGGTKLGTGGLQRAYSDAVSQVLKDLVIKLKVARTPVILTFDYTHDGNISRLLTRYDVQDIEPDYAQQVTLSIAIATSELSTFKAELINITAGNVEVLLPDSD